MTDTDAQGAPGGPPAQEPGGKRIVLTAVGILVLALVAGDLRVLLVGVPAGVAAGLSHLARDK